MRIKKSLYIIITTLLMTLSGPLQAVTASQLAEKDDNQQTTMRLPNEGRSDLQELIQRVNANVGESASDEPEPETDDPEAIKTPAEDSEVTAPESKEAEINDDQKAVVKAKAPRAITTNTNGTSTWTFDSDTGLLIFGAGELSQRIDTNLTNAGVAPTAVKSIQFERLGATFVTVQANISYLFANLGQLSSFIDFSNFDTATVTSMAYWFYNCKGLTNPDFSYMATVNVTNMSYMFYGSGITNLNLSSWNVDKVTTFNYMFYNATDLTTLNLSNWGASRTATAVSMSYMLYNTSALTTLTLTNFKTTNVTAMNYMFNNAGLTSLDISGWDMTKVTTFAYMFNSATSLTTLNLSNWGVSRTADTVSMVGMFYGTSKLINLNLTNFKTTNVTAMNIMFRGSGLTNQDFSSWDVTKVTNFDGMFRDTIGLTTLNLSNWGANRTATNVSMVSMFNNTSALTNLNLTNFKTTNVTSMPHMFNNTALTSLDLSDWDVTKVTNFDSMFYYATKLTTLNLSNWGTNRTATSVSMASMLYNTSTLTNLTLTNFNTSYVTDMGYMFSKSSVLSLSLLSWDVTKVTNFQGMFEDCTKLTYLNLSNWGGATRTAQNVTMAYMFCGTTLLKSPVLEGFKTNNVIDMSYMFDSSGIESLNLTDWDMSQVNNVGYMFYNTIKLWRITLGNDVIFSSNPNFTEAPSLGTTISSLGQTFKTTAESWQAVGTGSDHHPTGNMVTTTQMYADRTEPVTYVWAQAPTFNGVSSLTFGTLGARDFTSDGSGPLATNWNTGSVNLINLESGPTYWVSVEQTSDWTANGTTKKVAKSDLSVRYAKSKLSDGAVNFWSSPSGTSEQSIAFNFVPVRNFNIWLNPNTVIDTELLGKQLESELTWTLSETP